MASVTWRSSWCVNDSSDANLPVASSAGVATLSSLPLQLTRPPAAVDGSVPCQVSLHWSPQPLRCLQLQLEIQSSARHVEIYVDGTRRNMLGEEEQGEVYLGTFRGTKQVSDTQTFTMSPEFKQSDKDCDVLKSLQTLRVKFVSLMGGKSVLSLQEFQCKFVTMEPVATVETSAVGLAAKMAGLGLGGGGAAAAAAPDVAMLLKGFQQTLEREMETKIARAIDAKLSTLSQRLAFSEQALYQLHKKMDAKDAHVQASLVQIQQKFSQLEDQLSQFSVAKEAGMVENEVAATAEGTDKVDIDDVEQKKEVPADAAVNGAETE